MRFKTAEAEYRIFDNGSTAVLLKIDEFQQRLGKPSALLRKGVRKGDDSSPVLPPQLKPVREIPELALGGHQTINAQDPRYAKLWAYAAQQEGSDIEIYPFDGQHSLVEFACEMFAYNANNYYLVMDNALQNVLAQVDDRYTGYDQGTLLLAHKGRGIGDCWSTQRAVWTGKTFELSYQAPEQLCRTFAGGAWALPTFVSSVKTH